MPQISQIEASNLTTAIVIIRRCEDLSTMPTIKAVGEIIAIWILHCLIEIMLAS
jgi:hypothetical protein